MGRTSNTKERLLQAGRDLIWKRSHGAVTIDAICAKAREVLSQYYGYFEKALRDAQAEGSIKSSNLPATV